MALREQVTNGYSFTLAASITAGVATLTPPSYAAPAPQVGQFRVVIDSEILTVTDASVHPWPVTRGAESTTAAAHVTGAAVRQQMTAGALANLDAGLATLTDAAHILWNLALGHGSVTLGATRILDNPTGLVAGALYVLQVIQDATGSRLLTYGTAYKFPAATAPTLTATAAAVDVLTFWCDGTNLLLIATSLNVH
jgi:hypothetical protein